MPPLDDKDRQEIDALIAKSFGVPEGKTVAQFFGEETESRINTVLNKYDKRQAKDREELKKTLADLAASMQDRDRDDDDPPLDDKKKPPADSPEVKKLQTEMRDLAKKLESAQKERETERAEREKLEQATTHRALIDAVRTRALSKEVGVDPDKLSFLLDHLDHNRSVRLNEGKTGYEIALGKDKSGEAIWDNLDDGLAKFVKTGSGSFFLPAVKGTSGAGSGGGKPGSGGDGSEPTTSVGLIKKGLEKLASGQLEK